MSNNNLSNLRVVVQDLQKLPDAVFGYDLTPVKDAATDTYNVLNDFERRLAALEARQAGQAPIS